MSYARTPLPWFCLTLPCPPALCMHVHLSAALAPCLPLPFYIPASSICVWLLRMHSALPCMAHCSQRAWRWWVLMWHGCRNAGLRWRVLQWRVCQGAGVAAAHMATMAVAAAGVMSTTDVA